MKIYSIVKICYLKIRGVHIGRFSNAIIRGLPRIRYGGLISIGKSCQLGMVTRINGLVTIGDNFFMNEFGSINAGTKKDAQITIGNDVMLGPGVFIQAGDHGFSSGSLYRLQEGGKSGSIIIGNNCRIGAKTIILKGVSIGDNCVIGAGSVVTKDIPTNTIAVGNPAKVIRHIL